MGDVSLFAGAGGGDRHGAARLLISGGDVDGVEVVTNGGAKKSLGYQIHRVGGGIYDGGSGNALLEETGTAAAGKISTTGSRAAVEHAGVPELGAGLGVNRVNRIRLCGDVDHVVSTVTGNVHVGHVEGLGHHDIIHRKTEELPETVHLDVGWGEQGLIGIRAVAGAITAAGWKTK